MIFDYNVTMFKLKYWINVDEADRLTLGWDAKRVLTKINYKILVLH